MARLLLILSLVTGMALGASPCLADAPPQSSPIEVAAMAALKSAQSEQDRLQARHKAAEAYLAEETRRSHALRNTLNILQRLIPALMEADTTLWEKTRTDLNAEELGSQLGAWEAARLDLEKTGISDATLNRTLKDSLDKAKIALASFDRDLPKKPDASDWNNHRDKLLAAVQKQQSALSIVSHDSEALAQHLRQRLQEAAMRLESLAHLIRMLSSPSRQITQGGKP